MPGITLTHTGLLSILLAGLHLVGKQQKLSNHLRVHDLQVLAHIAHPRKFPKRPEISEAQYSAATARLTEYGWVSSKMYGDRSIASSRSPTKTVPTKVGKVYLKHISSAMWETLEHIARDNAQKKKKKPKKR